MTRLLIDEGRKRALRQYSFLTPQDMTLPPADFIKIHRYVCMCVCLIFIYACMRVCKLISFPSRLAEPDRR